MQLQVHNEDSLSSLSFFDLFPILNRFNYNQRTSDRIPFAQIRNLRLWKLSLVFASVRGCKQNWSLIIISDQSAGVVLGLRENKNLSVSGIEWLMSLGLN